MSAEFAPDVISVVVIVAAVVLAVVSTLVRFWFWVCGVWPVECFVYAIASYASVTVIIIAAGDLVAQLAMFLACLMALSIEGAFVIHGARRDTASTRESKGAEPQ